MSAEDILRERLKEYRELLNAIYCFLDGIKWDHLYEEDKKVADRIMEKLKENGIGSENE